MRFYQEAISSITCLSVSSHFLSKLAWTLQVKSLQVFKNRRHIPSLATQQILSASACVRFAATDASIIMMLHRGTCTATTVSVCRTFKVFFAHARASRPRRKLRNSDTSCALK